MPRVSPRLLSLLLGLVPSLHGGPIRADDTKASGPPPKGEVDQVFVRQEPDLPRHGARLLDLRAEAI